jgi:hypothetical protein
MNPLTEVPVLLNLIFSNNIASEDNGENDIYFCGKTNY